MGYQPSPNCIHYFEGRCAHPASRRVVGPNKLCVLTDIRVSDCAIKVESEPSTPMPPVKNPPKQRPVTDHVPQTTTLQTPLNCMAKLGAYGAPKCGACGNNPIKCPYGHQRGS